jgi:hypothetical protein
MGQFPFGSILGEVFSEFLFGVCRADFLDDFWIGVGLGRDRQWDLLRDDNVVGLNPDWSS